MAFSGGVKLGDLDDFIALSQECVKPLIEAAGGGGSGAAKLSSVSEAKALPVAEVAVVQRPNLIKSKASATNPKAQIGQVTLSDCLACSGCVTSAETVLLQEQSGEEFCKRAASAPLTVVSISGEARTSLAAAFRESPLQALQRAAEALRRLGADHVLDCSAAEAVALLEGKAEFLRRYHAQHSAPGVVSGGSSSSTSRAALGSHKTAADNKPGPSLQLPLLSSHCPGWTLYAEKVVEPGILPHLSPLRPPQQIQGRLVKTCLLEAHNRRRLHRWWRSRSPLFAAESWVWTRQVLDALAPGPDPLTPGDIYHVSVQPCYDRKIEASRPMFEVAAGVKEVDTVLTATELLELCRNVEEEGRGADSEGTEGPRLCCPLDSEVLADVFLGRLADGGSGATGLRSTAGAATAPLICCVPGNAGSGGFAEHIFREAARELFSMELTAGPLEFQTKQNEDMKELCLLDPLTQKVLLRFTAAYGFRNIQNVIRRVSKAGANSTAACDSSVGHFVEIMACPGGCLNGGGQIPEAKDQGSAASTGEAAGVADGQQAARRRRLASLEELLVAGEGTVVVAPAEHPLVLPLYRYVASRAEGAAPGAEGASLESLVGSKPARSWLGAEWRSLKVDEQGQAVLVSSALKW